MALGDSTPPNRKCETCVFWKRDRGTFTATGWTGVDKKDGYCHFEPREIHKNGSSFCHNWLNKEGDKQ